MTYDPLSALRDEYAEIAVPDYPASVVAAARLARGPRRRRSPVFRFALAGAGGLLAGALFAIVPGPQHDAMLAFVARHEPVQTATLPTSDAPRTVSLDEARRLATFPVVVPQGVPVDLVRIGSDNSSVQMIVSPRSGARVLMVERPADTPDDRAATTWRSGTTSVTVLDPPDGSILRRLRQATGAP